MVEEAIKQSFINKIVPFAQKYSKNVFPSITIAQAVLESGWGESTLSSHYHNYFGIKGEGVQLNTLEDDGSGNYYQIKDGFRTYRSMEDSVKDHDAFFTSTPWRVTHYKDVLCAQTAEEQAKALQGSYATDTSYAHKLIEIINTYGLKQYDKE